MSESLTVDDLTFEVQRSGRRKTMEIIVDRAGELRLSAPPGVRSAAMEKFVREKRFWIYTKLAEKAALRQPIGNKEFITGEGFLYLGRSYRLLLVDKQDRPLKLAGGRFRLVRNEVDRGRQHFIQWYTEHAHAWLSKRVESWAPRLRVAPAAVDVRDLGFRWGSCSRNGTVNFHWAAILLPPRIVEYIAVHEMVHIHESNHTPTFWRRLERAMPDYPDRKAWLAERGGEHLAL